jgi:hypothetical protein
MARPGGEPLVMPRATEPTPAMVATPRTMQARKMPKPPSRRAARRANGRRGQMRHRVFPLAGAQLARAADVAHDDLVANDLVEDAILISRDQRRANGRSGKLREASGHRAIQSSVSRGRAIRLASAGSCSWT